MVQRIRADRRLRRLGSFASALKQKDVAAKERLLDAERPGTASKFTTEQILQLFTIACEPPEKYGRPISHWTSIELAAEMENQEIVETISPKHVARLLSEATLKPHQSEYWLPYPNIATKLFET